MSEIYLVRHAQASYLSDNYDKLSEVGEKQSQLLAKYLHEKSIKFDQAFVGPLVRQNQTFNFIKEQNDIAHTTNLLNLKEHEGPKALKLYYEDLINESEYVRNLWEAFQKDPSLRRKNSLLIFEHFIRKWIRGEIRVNGTEPWSEFKTNALFALSQIRSNTHKNQRSLVVSSGGTIAAMLSSVLKMHDMIEVAQLNYLIRNASITKLTLNKDRISLLSFNEVTHLPVKMHTFV